MDDDGDCGGYAYKAVAATFFLFFFGWLVTKVSVSQSGYVYFFVYNTLKTASFSQTHRWWRRCVCVAPLSLSLSLTHSLSQLLLHMISASILKILGQLFTTIFTYNRFFFPLVACFGVWTTHPPHIFHCSFIFSHSKTPPTLYMLPLNTHTR